MPKNTRLSKGNVKTIKLAIASEEGTLKRIQGVPLPGQPFYEFLCIICTSFVVFPPSNYKSNRKSERADSPIVIEYSEDTIVGLLTCQIDYK